MLPPSETASSEAPVSPRVLIVTAGSHGDVHPFLGIGRALTARGARVGVLVNPHFEREVRDAELEFLPFGELSTTAELIHRYGIMDPFRGSERVLKLLCELAPEAVATMRAARDRFAPDAMIGHHICLGMTDVARERGIPIALALLAPTPLFSPLDPALPTQFFPGALGRMLGRALFPIAKRLGIGMFDRAFARARAAAGLPAVKETWKHEWFGGDRLLAMWSPRFRGALTDDPPRMRICGFPLYDEPNAPPLAPDIDAFLREGEPPILFCLGSTAVHVPGNFYENAIEVTKSLGRRAILLAGPHAPKFDRSTPAIRAIDYAPLHQLAPRCAVNVIHGGVGTTAQALRAGKPILVAPFAHDQFNNGVRVANLGCGDSIAARRLTAKRMRRALERLLGDSAIRENAARIGAAIRDERGAERAATEVLDLARRETGSRKTAEV
jgi:rhamnosyltransferase subunit B